MSSSDREGLRETPVTAQGLLRRYLTILILAALAALIPYLVPYDSISDVPRVFVVTYYGLLALVAGWFGIVWIFQTARLVLRIEHASLFAVLVGIVSNSLSRK